MQHAVEAITHAQGILARLNMDIGGLHVDGARDQVMGEPDDGCFARHVLQAAHVLIAGLPRRQTPGPAEGASAAVDLLDGALNDAGRHQSRLDGPAEQKPNRRDRIGIEWVGGGNDNGLALFGQGDQSVAGEEVELKVFGQEGNLRQVLGFCQRHAEEVGQQASHLDIGQQAEPRQDQIKTLAGLFLRALGAVHGQFIERAPLRRGKLPERRRTLRCADRRRRAATWRTVGSWLPPGACKYAWEKYYEFQYIGTQSMGGAWPLVPGARGGGRGWGVDANDCTNHGSDGGRSDGLPALVA